MVPLIIKQTSPCESKANFFLLVDLQDFYSDLGSGTEKANKAL